MPHKLAVIGYVPGPKYGCGEAFLQNIEKNPPTNELILFSDERVHPLINIKLPGSVEDVKEEVATRGPYQGRKNPFAVNNRCFFTAMRIAIKQGASHVLLVEDDVRVRGKGWDEKIFAEFFNNPNPILIGGSVVVYNPSNSNLAALRRWEELIKSNTRRNFPIPTYGTKGAADGSGTAVFVNGAGGVYSIDAIKMLFPNLMTPGATFDLAVNDCAWDFSIGFRIWEKFKEHAYDLVGMINCIFSGYGDVLTSELDRLQMLRSGDVCLVHQVKSKVVE